MTMITFVISRRRIVIAFAVFFVITVVIYHQRAFESPLFKSSSHNVHPVERLQDEAVQRHNLLLSRQSSELPSAIAAYEARYDLKPPSGFDAWFKRAKELNSPIIDDYDSINQDLAPFRSYFRARNDLKAEEGYKDTMFKEKILQACVGNSNITFEGFQEPWFRDSVETLFTEVAPQIPKVCIMINLLDEARVLPDDTSSETDQPKLSFEHITDHHNLWPEVSRCCPKSEPASEPASRYSKTLTNLRHHLHLSAPDSSPISSDTHHLATNWTTITDICTLIPPIHYSPITSPSSPRLTNARLPIVSTSKLSPFSDILLPSIWRFAEVPQTFSRDPNSDPDSPIPREPPTPEDPPWQEKHPSIYWRGSTTGGYATFENWRTLHRQSLILNMTTHLSPENLDLAFTDTIQCEFAACSAQRETLPMSEPELRVSGARHKLVLDMDGNGLSGRLYDLLRSSSAVLRYSFQREWHDARLQPWLHYIPLTNSAEEVGEVVRFLLGTERGDQVLQTVAKESREWAGRSLRNEDMMLYAWRLLLEMARNRWDDGGVKGSAAGLDEGG